MRKFLVAIMALAFLVGVSGFVQAETTAQTQAIKTESKAVKKKLKKDAKKGVKKTAGSNELVKNSKVS